MNEKKYKQHLMIWIIATIILVGISYYTGNKHGQSKSSAFQNQIKNGQMGANRTGRFGMTGGLITGDVLSKDATSMTIKMRDGSSRIILYSGTTQVLKSTAGTTDDVTTGTSVSIQGTQNTDGSITAQSIQIRPAMPAVTKPAQ